MGNELIFIILIASVGAFFFFSLAGPVLGEFFGLIRRFPAALPHARKMRSIFKSLKKKYGLDYMKGLSNTLVPVEGEIEGNDITVGLKNLGGDFSIEIAWCGKKYCSYAFEIYPEGSNGALTPQQQSRIQIDRDSFFRIVRLSGCDGCNAVDGSMLADLKKILMIMGHFSCKGSRLQLSVPLQSADAPVVNAMIALLFTLSSQILSSIPFTEHLGRWLLETIKTGADPLLRKQHLGIVVRNHRNTPLADEALAHAVCDANHEVRILALDELGRDIVPELMRLLESGTAAEKRAALRLIRERRKKECLDYLLQHFGETGEPDESIELIETCAAFEDTRFSPLLVQELGNPRFEIRRAAIEALAVCGDAASIAPLRAFAEKEDILVSLRSQACVAITEIHNRLGLPLEGLLSIAELTPPDGALSLHEKAREEEDLRP